MAVKEQISQETMPKGQLRLISKTWLDSFIKYAEEGQAEKRPGPIMNFELVLVTSASYNQMDHLKKLHQTDVSEWQ